MEKRLVNIVLLVTASALALTGCSSAANVSSYNISKESDNFQVNRRIVFFNGITDKYLLEIEGKCSIKADGADSQLEVVCKTSENGYKKHFLGLSDNVSYFVEHLEPTSVDDYHYTVRFRPETIVPNIDIDTSR